MYLLHTDVKIRYVGKKNHWKLQYDSDEGHFVLRRKYLTNNENSGN